MIEEAKTHNLPDINQSKQLAVMENFGGEGLDSSDMLISRLVLQQPLSRFVSEGKAMPGDIVDSVTGEVIVKKGSSIEVVPVLSFKDWHVSHFINNQWEFQGKTPFSPNNALWAKEAIEEGVQIKRDLALNYFVLVRGRTNELPYLLTFKRTSYYAGRKMSTAIQKNIMLQKGIAHTTFKLSSTLQTFEKFNFFVLEVDKGNPSQPEEQLEALKWNQILKEKKQAVEVDNSVDNE